jgi:hypothetical protein
MELLLRRELWDLIVFFKIRNVNIFPVISVEMRKNSTACFVIALCMPWETGVAAILLIQKRELRTALIA